MKDIAENIAFTPKANKRNLQLDQSFPHTQFKSNKKLENNIH